MPPTSKRLSENDLTFPSKKKTKSAPASDSNTEAHGRLSGTPPYDVCFGLVGCCLPTVAFASLSDELMPWQLLMEASYQCNSWKSPAKAGPVQISFLDNFLTLRSDGTGEHAGVLVSETLSRLVRECSITLASTIGKAKASRTRSLVIPRPLCIVVYGFMSERDTVKSILGEGSLFLQCPDEYDRRIRYFNPMYLLPPGEDMPSTTRPPVAASRTQDSGSSDEQELDEVEKAHILRVFDEAAGGCARAASLQIQQSSRIISVLKEYEIQLQSAGRWKKKTDSITP